MRNDGRNFKTSRQDRRVGIDWRRAACARIELAGAISIVACTFDADFVSTVSSLFPLGTAPTSALPHLICSMIPLAM